MDSKLARQAKRAVLDATRQLSPEQRLEAFLNHCRLMSELHQAGRQLRRPPAQKRS